MLEKLPEVIGHVLGHQRAGMEKLLYNADLPKAEACLIEVRSQAFVPDSELPRRFTADGAGVSPPLSWSNIPASTAALVLIVEDPDSPTPEPLVHGIVVDIDPREVGLEEGVISAAPEASPEKLGRNSYLMAGWLPPDPPPGHGVHHYVFQVFALAAGHSLSQSPGRGEVAAAVRDRGIGKGYLIGTYQREVPIRDDEQSEPLLAGASGVALAVSPT